MKCNQDCEQGRNCDEDMYDIDVWMVWLVGIILTLMLGSFVFTFAAFIGWVFGL